MALDSNQPPNPEINRARFVDPSDMSMVSVPDNFWAEMSFKIGISES